MLYPVERIALTNCPIIPSPLLVENREGCCAPLHIMIVDETNDQTISIPIIAASKSDMFGSPIHAAVNLLYREMNAAFPQVSIILAGNGQDHGKSIETCHTMKFTAASLPFSQSPDAYALDISEKQMAITAPSKSGFFYAIQTLLQIIQSVNGELVVPCGHIEDAPAFPMRGLLHDVGRNFQPIPQLKRQADIWAKYKLNIFHFHLTDNPSWRIESKAYPQLNDPKFQVNGRDPGKFYSYDELRDFIAYCNDRCIQVIPEIDMPGHSKSFRKAMKCTMNSFRGMRILQRVLTEFFQEIPQNLAPMIHIGSDEVHIWNKKAFIHKICEIVKKADREIVMWNPGLPPPQNVILQNWGPKPPKYDQMRYLDSTHHYINSFDPMACVPALFFYTPCEGLGDQGLGAILCMWPDVRVSNPKKIARFNPLYSSILVFAERMWQPWPTKTPVEFSSMIEKDPLFPLFAQFEDRLVAHRDRYFATLPFPYIRQRDIVWNVIGPYDHHGNPSMSFEVERQLLPEYSVDDKNFAWKRVRGGSIVIRHRAEPSRLFQDFPQEKVGTCYALTKIISESDQEISAWIGFETPERSHRQYAGIPPKGQWDANGGQVWLNNQPLPAPEWKEAGKYSHWRFPTWNFPCQEDPFTDEEFYWTRPLYQLKLRKGENTVLIRIPAAYPKQIWQCSFVPVKISPGSKNARECPSIQFLDPGFTRDFDSI